MGNMVIIWLTCCLFDVIHKDTDIINNVCVSVRVHAITLIRLGGLLFQ